MYKSKSSPQIVLRPHDFVVLLRLSLLHAAPTYEQMAGELMLTKSEIHASLERAALAQLVRKPPKDGVLGAHTAKGTVVLVRQAFIEFALHGAAYAYPAVRGEVVRGMPTGYAAPPLSAVIVPPVAAVEPPPVWPDAAGTVRGSALYPLYPSVPLAALRLPALYELLTLFDALRAGSNRERALARTMLAERLAREPEGNPV
jgi:hypothetical protein